MLRTTTLVLCLLLLTACGTPSPVADWFVNDRAGHTPTPQRFTQCHGYGCSLLTQTGLEKDEWKKIVTLFDKKKVKTAAAERAAVAVAVGDVRKIVGEKTGTGADHPGTHYMKHGDYDMDCVDESVNTVTTLRLITQAKLLKFHTLEQPALRGNRFFQTLHHTAVLKETASGERYAIDPWEVEQGEAARVMRVAEWLRD